MAVIYIDNVPYEVKAGKNLLEACLSLGFDLPYFCWHPAMGSVGACRQCAVKLFKDDQDTKGRLVMSCMESVRDNLYCSIEDTTAKAFRSQVIEWLMTNHPHDCAVCDEGGSCHLQDMTVMTGHAYRRFNYKKRTYNNQYLGPLINHEMNRCIQCYRCVRFYKDYAGGKDLDVFAAHNNVYFGRATDGVLENEFSGNLAEVCPTGVFTDKTLKEHYTRKWDLTMAPSICQHCSLGCNIIAGERYGELRQITNRYNGDVNGYFICDRGRFGYEYVNSLNRIQHPLIRSHVPEAVNRETLFDHLKPLLSGKVIGVGSPRASLESNFALRQLVGENQFFSGVPETTAEMMEIILSVFNTGDVRIPSMKETEEADVVLILGEDLNNSAPRLALSVRQAVRNNPVEVANTINIPAWHDAALRELVQSEKGDCFIAYPVITKLDELASGTYYISPDEIARLGYAIANFLDPQASAVPDLQGNMQGHAVLIGNSLQKAKNPLIVTGVSLQNPSIIKAAAAIAAALGEGDRKAMLAVVVPDCNSMGLAMMNAPSILNSTALSTIGSPDTLIILENDLFSISQEAQISEILDRSTNIIVLDHLHNPTSARADIVIPVGTFSEADGTLVNNEGRAQAYFQVYMPKNENLRESWRWLSDLKNLRDGTTDANNVTPHDLIRQLADKMPQFTGADQAMPTADLRIKDQKIPREPHRYSGRTAMNANLDVSEPKPPSDPDTPLSFTMEGYKGLQPAPLNSFFWSPGWNSNQSVHKYQMEVGGALYGGNPGVRLFNHINPGDRSYMNGIPPRFKPDKENWEMLPLPHLFGSEALSSLSKGIAELSPQPYVAINSMDAESLNVDEGSILQVIIEGVQYELPVKIKPELPARTAGLPYNLQELTGIKWPAHGQLVKG
ncbi:NADH-quinone oxidoreductase subunit NuoG [Flavihumibacter sp. R14]|nr:NADH-quinone oxidoreductase subunit NuoG [Flavihumibacter soli]